MNMIEKEYVNDNFLKEIVLIPEELCDLAEELHKKYGNHEPIIVDKDKKSLCFVIDKSTEKISKEKKDHLYRIRIEKIEYKYNV